MKANWLRNLILTAMVLGIGGVSYAQVQLRAKVPFSFRVHDRVLPAGEYAVQGEKMIGVPVLTFYNRDTRESFSVLGSSSAYGSDGPARLVFRCSDAGGCALAAAWNGTGRGIEMPSPRLSPAEKARFTVLSLTPSGKK